MSVRAAHPFLRYFMLSVESIMSSTKRPFPVACFSLTAESEPGLLSRVLALFAKRSIVPHRIHSTLCEDGRGGSELAVDIQVEGMDPALASLVTRQLDAVVGVRWVAFAEKGSQSFSRTALSA